MMRKAVISVLVNEALPPRSRIRQPLLYPDYYRPFTQPMDSNPILYSKPASVFDEINRARIIAAMATTPKVR